MDNLHEMLHALELASALQDGIQPAWEDDRNRKGGRWLITLNKNQRSSELDHFWMETVIMLDRSVTSHSIITVLRTPYPGSSPG